MKMMNKKNLTKAIVLSLLTTCVAGGVHRNLALAAEQFPDRNDSSIVSAEGKLEIETNKKQTSSIAIGKGAIAHIDEGGKATGIKFGNDTFTGAIAIGEGSVAFNNSINIGIKSYKGLMGDVDLTKYRTYYASNAGVTTIGNDSFTSGALSTNIGTYNIVTTKYGNGGGSLDALQNFGTTTVGTMNSIESPNKTEFFAALGGKISGVANSIVGIANKTSNTNGSLIFGAGNEITNSIGTLNQPSNTTSVKDAADSFREIVKKSNSGGAVLAIGGGNKADKTLHSQLVGVNNTVNSSDFVFVDGYTNKVTDSKHTSVIGSDNTVTGNQNIVIGDKHKIDKDVNNIIIGSADKELLTEASDAVIIGHNANAGVDGGVALGSGSIANVGKGAVGFYDWDNFDRNSLNVDYDSPTWKSTHGAVSVGSNVDGQIITRQITNVAAGTADTDAVNVAQLKKLADYVISKDNFLKQNPDNLPADGAGTGTDAGHGDYSDGSSDGSYTVSKDNDIKLEVGSEDGTHKHDVVLKNVAKHTDEIAGGSINNDGTVTLKQNDGDTVKLDGQIHDYALKEVQYDQADESGTMTFKVQDKYSGKDAEDITVTGIASKKDIGDVRNEMHNEVTRIDNSIDKLGNRLDKVGAGAAALAALHPLDFDPDDKLSFAAGVGNYAGENAAALGMFYRPDEKVMFSLAGTVGNDENMVNAGISFALDGTSRVSNSRTAMAKEIVEMRDEMGAMRAQMAQMADIINKLSGNATSGLVSNTMFPDVSENHWAYEYIKDLADRGIIEGYPDGNFSGDRSMTRYEFAAMLDRALSKGVKLDARIAAEFEPELGRIRVDRISGADGDRHKVERVRVNSQKDRDVYGSVLPVVVEK